MLSKPSLSAISDLHFEADRHLQLIEIQRKVLEVLATTDNFQLALDELCLCVERILPGSAASVMVFEQESGALRIRAAPSLAPAAAAELDGLKPGENQGSCGTALFKNEPQYVSDTLNDARWGDFQAFASKHGIYSCWSYPIRTSESSPVGTVALSGKSPRVPSRFDKVLLETCAYLAGIILTREKQDEALKKAANFDELTGLPNRYLFRFRLENQIQHAKRNKTKFALLYIDLDKFKPVNDLYGHDCGDEVLKEVAIRIRSVLRQNDLIARFGGDEFLVLVEDSKSSHALAIVAEKILKSLQSPIHIGQIKVNISASIGIAIYPKNGDSSAVLIQHADEAMYQAKASSGSAFRFYYRQLN